jgi:regulator of protease activity HflC (stomatin/prohibitin superfamily)
MEWHDIFKVWLEVLPFLGVYLVVSQLQHRAVIAKFDTIDEKFKTVDEKFTTIDTRFGERFNTVDTKFATVDANFQATIKTIESGFATAVAQLEKTITESVLTHVRAEHGTQVPTPKADRPTE